jgi:hypothetical protein
MFRTINAGRTPARAELIEVPSLTTGGMISGANGGAYGAPGICGASCPSQGPRGLRACARDFSRQELSGHAQGFTPAPPKGSLAS